jgi:hypothetical protein
MKELLSGLKEKYYDWFPYSMSRFVKTGKHSKARHFLQIQSLLVIGFTLAYWLADKLYEYFPDTIERLGLGTIRVPGDLYSYLYFSLITQTTVGYGGTLPDGADVISTKSEVIRILSLMQLVSVIMMMAWAL